MILQPPNARIPFSLDGTLDALHPWVSPALCPAGRWGEVHRVARLLPAALASAVYLECRLGSSDSPVDLIVRLDARGRDLLLDADVGGRLPVHTEPTWGALLDLCRRWSDPAGELHRCVDHLWLEFDVDGAPGDLPALSVFLGLAAEASSVPWPELVDTAARSLLGRPLSPATEQGLHDAIARRPAGATVPYLGFMMSRAEAAVRLYFGGPQEAEFAAFLHEAAWAPCTHAEFIRVPPALRNAAAAPALGMVHVDFADGLLPRVGMEYTLARREQLRGVVVEELFLDALVEQGWCTAEKRAGLLAWAGSQVCALPHELAGTRVDRRVNCVKFVFHAERGWEAKGYLLATPRAPGARPASTR